MATLNGTDKMHTYINTYIHININIIYIYMHTYIQDDMPSPLSLLPLFFCQVGIIWVSLMEDEIAMDRLH